MGGTFYDLWVAPVGTLRVGKSAGLAPNNRAVGRGNLGDRPLTAVLSGICRSGPTGLKVPPIKVRSDTGRTERLRKAHRLLANLWVAPFTICGWHLWLALCASLWVAPFAPMGGTFCTFWRLLRSNGLPVARVLAKITLHVHHITPGCTIRLGR